MQTSIDTKKLFIFYCFVGFSIPSFFTFVLAFLEHFPHDGLDTFRPDIGAIQCMISNKTVELYMWTIPMIMSVFGSLLFIVASLKIVIERTANDSEGYTRLTAEKDW
jgi:hypothetical protein